MPKDSKATQTDVLTFHRRYALAATLAMVALAASFLTLLVRDFRHHRQAHRQLEMVQFAERVAHLDSLLALVTSTIEMTRREAQQDLLLSAEAKAIDHQPIRDLIKDSPDRTYFHIERFRPPITKETIGNLTGEGSIKGRDRELYREIHMAYGLFPHFSSAVKTLKSSAWVYYISAMGFEAIYPWVSSRQFRFSKQNYTHDYYTRALPENNPSRSVFWTGVYMDDYGKGLMTTCGAPIYEGEHFRGTVDIDLTVDFLNKAIHRFSLTHGVMCIVNEQGQVVAHPGLTASADARVKMLRDVLPEPLRAQMDAVGRTSLDAPSVMDGFTIMRARTSHAPWDVFHIEPADGAVASFVSAVGLWPPMLAVALLCTLAAILLSTHSYYLKPSRRLLQHIEATSHSDTSHEAELVPRFWRPWFTRIERIFRQNQELTDEVRRQNQELEKRVQERTAELAGANRQLEAENAERTQAEAQLREWQNRYEVAVSASGHLLYDWNSATNEVTYGGNVESMLGYTLDEMAGGLAHWVELIHPEDRVQFQADIEHLIATREGAHLEYRVRRQGGHYVTVENDGQFIRDARGEMVRMIGFVKDVTKRRRAEEALRASEEKYRQIVETAREGVWVIDTEGRTTFANRRMAEMVGCSQEELLASSMWDFIDEEARPEARTLLEKRKEGVAERHEFRFIRKDGSDLWTLVSTNPLTDDSGNVVGALGMVTDIAELKRAEGELRESEERYRRVVEDQTEFIVRWRPDGVRIFVNEHYCRYFGLTQEEALGDGFFPLIVEEDREAVQQRLDALAPDAPVSSGEHRVILPDGSIGWNRWTDRALFDEQRRLQEYQSIGRDITERKLMESQLHEASKMEAIGRLAGGIAHDFNNMLMGIVGYTHFLRQRVDDPALVSDLDAVRKLADRGASLTQQLLAFGRRQRLERRQLDLNDQIRSTSRMLPRLIGENIELQFRPDSDLAYVNADPAQVDQILMNLAVNARDAMPRGGALTISTGNVTFDAEYVARNPGSKAGDYAMFEVADTGEGMDQETLSHLFEPFYTTKEVGQGTGLGLATIYGIVKQHDGYTAVDSELGRGTTFRVYLPRTEGEPEAPDQEPILSRGPRGQEKVLMVEDEPAVRNVIGRALRNHGYQVLLASNADEALAIAEQHEGAIDLLLTDIVMPGRSGRELHAELLTKRPSVRVLFMSGYDEQSVIVRDVQAAGLPFIAKPIDVLEIAERVREALDE